MKHNRQLEGYKGNVHTLAQELGNLTYDTLADFLKRLGNKLDKDSKADSGRGRANLSNQLKIASTNLLEAQEAIKKAWTICEPHMNSSNMQGNVIPLDDQGRRHGVSYYDNSLSSIETHKHDQLHGLVEDYYDGRLSWSDYFRNGMRFGSEINYEYDDDE